MKPITMTFGGYQPPASIHNQSARRFGELLEQKLGDRITFTPRQLGAAPSPW